MTKQALTSLDEAQDPTRALFLTPELVRIAREWLMDLTWRDVEPEDFAEDADEPFTDREIEKAIARFWAGGVADFIVTQS